MPSEHPPRTIRVAGALTIVEAVVGVGFVVALVLRAGEALGGVGALDSQETYGEAGYYAIVSLAVLAAGIGLWRGKHWARTPALLLQLLLLGAAWYALGPSRQPLLGLLIAVPAVAVLWFMFNRQGRAWSFYASAAPDADSEQR